MPREFTASQQARLFVDFRAADELIEEKDLDKVYAPASTIPAINSQIALLAAEDAALGESVAAEAAARSAGDASEAASRAAADAAIQAVAGSALQPAGNLTGSVAGVAAATVAAGAALGATALQPNAPIAAHTLVLTSAGTLNGTPFAASATLKFDATGRLTSITTA